MGDGMPYHLEKGPLLRVIERNLNADRATMQATLAALRAPAVPGSFDWLTNAVPPLWSDPAFSKPGAPSATTTREHIIKRWFGYERDAAGNWYKPDPPVPTTDYWIGYRGDVDRIVREALAWAVELALSTGLKAGSDPWPIELFWKCPAPWFEAWVVSRKSEQKKTGVVTVIMVSPSHRGAIVASSPVATSPTASPATGGHPVPSTEDDYEWRGEVPHPRPGRPVVNAVDRDYATWVVSQKEHQIIDLDRARHENTAEPQPIGGWQIPELARWEGTGEVVVVAPSMAAGGVKHDGKV